MDVKEEQGFEDLFEPNLEGINSHETRVNLNINNTDIESNQNNQNIQDNIPNNIIDNYNINNSNQNPIILNENAKKLLGKKTKPRKNSHYNINKKISNNMKNYSFYFINDNLPIKNKTFRFLKTEPQKGEFTKKNIFNSFYRPIKEKLMKYISPKFTSFHPDHNKNLIQIIEKNKNKEEFKFVLDLIERNWIDYIKAFRGDYANAQNEPLKKLYESRQKFIIKLSSKYENEYIELVEKNIDNFELINKKKKV